MRRQDFVFTVKYRSQGKQTQNVINEICIFIFLAKFYIGNW